MPDNPEEIYKEWFQKAAEDEMSIGAILKEGGAPSTACFLAQQMVEKYLKGFLAYRNKAFPKVHDLLSLENLLLPIDPEIREYEHELDLLGSYYVETRYPGDYPDFTVEDAREALTAARKIKEFVLKKLGS